MNYSKHCDFCVYQKNSLKTGSICGLTKSKPSFIKTCSKIEFNGQLRSNLKSINIDFERIKILKLKKYFAFVIMFSISIIVMIVGFYYAKMIWKSGLQTENSLIVMAIGSALMGVSLYNLQEFKKEKNSIEIKKKRIDFFLDLYKIKYSISVKFGKEIHGSQNVYVDLKIKSDISKKYM